MDNKVMRERAWASLFKGKWLMRLFLLTLLFGAINFGVGEVLSAMFGTMGVKSFNDFRYERLVALITKTEMPEEPTTADLPPMIGATIFESFISFIFAGIFALGMSKAQLKAADGRQTDWFDGSLDGFKNPLGLFALNFLISLRLFLWTLLLIVPGIIAIYRYRMAWFVKAEHPEYGARKCIAESAAMMRGYKWRAFNFDCSYWKFGTVAMLPMLFASATLFVFLPDLGFSTMVKGMVAFLDVFMLSLSAIMFLIFGYYFSVGKAVFYRELGNLKGDTSEIA